MEIKQAVEVVSQVVALAQKGGLLTLQDAVLTVQALQTLESLVAQGKPDLSPHEEVPAV